VTPIVQGSHEKGKVAGLRNERGGGSPERGGEKVGGREEITKQKEVEREICGYAASEKIGSSREGSTKKRQN